MLTVSPPKRTLSSKRAWFFGTLHGDDVSLISWIGESPLGDFRPDWYRKPCVRRRSPTPPTLVGILTLLPLDLNEFAVIEAEGTCNGLSLLKRKWLIIVEDR